MHIYPQHSFNKAFAYIVVVLLFCAIQKRNKRKVWGKRKTKKVGLANCEAMEVVTK